MSTAIVEPAGPADRDEELPPARPAPLGAGYRFELTKLIAQWRMRGVLLACWLVPALFVGVVSRQSSLPSDTVFGRWMNATGWAGALVVLAFCCSWALPLLTSLVAGDAFAVEDRLGTWRHLLLAVRSPHRIFVAKTLASLTVILAMVVGLAVSGVVGGLVAVGNHPLVGLDGRSLDPGDAATRVLLAWLAVLMPTLAFAAIGLLGSIVLGRSPMGLLVPAVLALALNLLQLLPLPVMVRLALPSASFLTWRGLFTTPMQTGPLLVALVVDVAWAVVALAAAYWLFLRRDFAVLANDGGGRRALVAAVVPLAAVTGLSVLALALFSPASGAGIRKGQLEESLSTVFAHLYRMQTSELHQASVTEQQLAASTSCDKGGDLVDDVGPGNDWRCVVSWHVPGSSVVGQAIYQLDVTADGRYVADGDGPKEVNGFFTLHTADGDVPNPLWQVDGLVDLLNPTAQHSTKE